MRSINEAIRHAVGEFGRLAVHVDMLSDTDDLYRAGLTSHASVNVMLALEDAFDIEFPEAMLRRQTFESIAAIRDAVDVLVDEHTPSSA